MLMLFCSWTKTYIFPLNQTHIYVPSSYFVRVNFKAHFYLLANNNKIKLALLLYLYIYIVFISFSISKLNSKIKIPNHCKFSFSILIQEKINRTFESDLIARLTNRNFFVFVFLIHRRKSVKFLTKSKTKAKHGWYGRVCQINHSNKRA